MLALCVYFTCPLTLLYLEVLANIKCSPIRRKNRFTKGKLKINNAKNHVIIFDNSQQFCILFIYGGYSRHEISASPWKSGVLFYSTKTYSQFPTFILELLYLYFSLCIFIEVGTIHNNKCQLITSTNTFKLTNNTKKYFRHLYQNYVYFSPVHRYQ